MAAGDVHFKFNDAGLARLNAPTGNLGRATARAAGKVRDGAKKNITQAGRVDTGALRQSGQVNHLGSTLRGVYYEVRFASEHAMYQHEGTKGPIYPRRAKFLRFKPKGGSAYVYARKVRGIRGIKFLTKSLNRLKVSDFKF